MTPKQKAALDVIVAAPNGTTVRRVASALGISVPAATERIRCLKRDGAVVTTHDNGGQSARLCTPARLESLRAEIEQRRRDREAMHNRTRHLRGQVYEVRPPVWQRVPVSVWHYAAKLRTVNAGRSA